MELYKKDYLKSERASVLHTDKAEIKYDTAVLIKKTHQYFGGSIIAAFAGAYLGLEMAPVIVKWYFGLIIFEFAALFGVIFTKSKPSLNAIMLFVFTFTSGITLTPLLFAILKMPAGAEIVTNALLLTGVAFGGLSLFAMNTKREFSFLGKFLFISLIILVVASLINIFIGSSFLQMIIASVGAIVFSGFILFDTQNILKGNISTPVEGAIALYLDTLNLFISLLQILGIFGSNDE